MKEFLSQNNIDFTDRNIAADETALNELEQLGYMTTPVTVIDGEVVVGYNAAKAEEPAAAQRNMINSGLP